MTVPEPWFLTETLVSGPNPGGFAGFALKVKPFVWWLTEVAGRVVLGLEIMVFLVADALPFVVVELIHVHIAAESGSLDLMGEARRNGQCAVGYHQHEQQGPTQAYTNSCH